MWPTPLSLYLLAMRRPFGPSRRSRVGTMPSADSSCAVGDDCSSPSQFPWHATSQDSPEVSRGKSYSRRCMNAGFIKHVPFVDGGLGGCVPTRPERTTPRSRFLFVAPHLCSTLPSDPTSR